MRKRLTGWEVTSLDNDPKAAADICCDICAWDYRAYPPGHFDYVHASPVCTEFSRALTARPRDLAAGDRLVDRVLEILTYFRPRWWTIENPDSYMKTRPNMQHLRAFMQRCCYCMYSDDETHAYRKPTCIWTNIPWEPRPMCTKAAPCRWRDESGSHPKVAQKGPSGSGAARGNKNTRRELYSMPPALVDEWVTGMGASVW